MDTNEAIEYLKKAKEETASQPVEPEQSKGPEVPTGEEQGKPEETPVPNSDVTGGSEPPKAEESETAADKQQQKKPTKQERINHAFQREKARHKEQLEAANKRIAELEEKVKKYSVLEQGDFDPNDMKSYIDHKFALQGEQAELENLKASRDKMIADENMRDASARHEQQVNDCFASDEEKEHYWALLRNGGAKFKEFLKEYDDGTIDQFIGDSEIAPVMISTLMRNPDVLRSIVEKRNPMRKAIALQQLENRLQLQRKLGNRPQSTGSQPTNQKPTQRLPIIGSQVANPGSATDSKKTDWNRYLMEHPRGT